MMSIAALEQSGLPAARTVGWTPLAGVSGLLLVVLLVARTSDRPVDLVLAMASAALASAMVGALHDPAATLLEAMPVSAMQRRALRLGIVLVPALVAWGVLTRVSDTSPGTASPLPLLALTAAGVAVAVWSPPHLGVLVGAFVPLLWFALDLSVPGAGLLSDAAGWWHTAPGAVLVVGLLTVVAGRRR